jgi:tRNA(adenine34) deaminase
MTPGWTAAMHAKYFPIIQQAYDDSRGSSIELFQTVLSIAGAAGMDDTLACLQGCVTARRLAWWQRTGRNMVTTNDLVMDGYRLFYENYLGLSIPKDGEIIEVSDRQMVSRWSNPCPTLEACKILGLDTREICKKVYQQPVQALLSKINPGLRFDRNYSSLRPHTPYCEEIITLVAED